MKTIEEPATLRNTQKQSASQCSFRLPVTKIAAWHFFGTSVCVRQAISTRPALFTVDVPIGALKKVSNMALVAMVIKNPYATQEEKPDFTEADKEWIAKIDRTKLTLEDW